MDKISLKSYAKINLSLDVLGMLDSGYHEISTVMQSTSLYDLIDITFLPSDDFKIEIKTNKSYLPTDEKNLAYKAALLMNEKANKKGTLKIEITKRIPVAAGLAGGSSNAAATIVGLNKIWKMGLSLDELMDLGKELGSDIPFLIYTMLSKKQVALGINRGEIIEPLSSKFNSYLVFAKPSFGVSTKEVYQGIDNVGAFEHPNTEALIDALKSGNTEEVYNNMMNVLENYTLKAYSKVKEVKELVKETRNVKFVQMSGSGPTIVGFYETYEDSKNAALILRKKGLEAYYLRTRMF